MCSPPLRTAVDNAALWELLAADDVQTVGTDHCPFFYEQAHSPATGGKDLGRVGARTRRSHRFRAGCPASSPAWRCSIRSACEKDA